MKTNEIRIRVSPEQKKIIKSKATLTGQSTASFLRMLGLKTKVDVVNDNDFR